MLVDWMGTQSLCNQVKEWGKSFTPGGFLLIGVIWCEACVHDFQMHHNEAVSKIIVVF